MVLKTFQCCNCGGAIPLDSSLQNITKCPYCGSDYYVDEKWEESVKAATQHSKQILVKNIRSIEIPALKNAIIQKDLEVFQRVNQSILCLEKARARKQERMAENREKIERIETSVGLKYDEVEEKIPEKVGYFSILSIFYMVLGVLVWIISTVQWFLEDDSIIVLFLLPFFSFVWPLAVTSSDPSVFIIYIFLAILILGPIIVYTVLSNKRNAYFSRMDELKGALDLERIDQRKLLLKDNVNLSSEIELLSSAIAEINRMRDAAGIHESTRQFHGLSPAETIQKIDFALNRMRAAPIDFEIACAGFQANREPVALPFEPVDRTEELIKQSLDHIIPSH